MKIKEEEMTHKFCFLETDEPSKTDENETNQKEEEEEENDQREDEQQYKEENHEQYEENTGATLSKEQEEDEMKDQDKSIQEICKNGPLRELKKKINSSNINSRDEVR